MPKMHFRPFHSPFFLFELLIVLIDLNVFLLVYTNWQWPKVINEVERTGFETNV